jgi:predicted nucleic acid-binding protein
MTSVDTNILLFAYSKRSPDHEAANAFLRSVSDDDSFAVSEFVLGEFYLHLRNPAVLENPLSPSAAVGVIQRYREHPRWRILGFPPGSNLVHQKLWKHAATRNFARRKIYDLRIALCLQAFGVTHFATSNAKDFRNAGFEKVWSPLK